MNSETTADSLALAAFGGSDFTLGFELVGVKIIISTDQLTPESCVDLLFSTLKRTDIGVLIADEKVLRGLSIQDRTIMENYIRPVVIVLSDGVSDNSSLRRQITRAIGVDVYAEKQ
jgi:vacuolar-type H+-ATPase subunit F/Vma7